MMRWRLVFGLLLGCAFPWLGRAQQVDSAATATEANVAAAIRAVGAALDEPIARPGVATGHASLRGVYAAGEYRPLWTMGGRPTSQTLAVIALLDAAAARGLRPADYDALALGGRASALAGGGEPPDAARLARFDLSLSRALLRLVADLHAGRVDPHALRFDLPETHGRIDLAAMVRAASLAGDPAAIVAAAEPRYAGYTALVAALARYRRLAADSALRLPDLPARTVRPGEALGAADALRRYLTALGDYRAEEGRAAPAADRRYDAVLAAAVAAFQRRHALEPDSVIGPATIRQLRVPLAQRVRQIELTLERWRWLPDNPPPRYAVVNIPAFRLVVFEHDSTAEHPTLAMSAIVGQAAGKHGTPIFTEVMEEVVFRPYWDVPLSIARKELVPRFRREPGYFATDSFEIVGRGDGDDTPRPPTSRNLDRVEAGELRLRQRPGRANALGRVKFVFPNSHTVYLHDTPLPELFARSRRDFSHGCIRIADPLALAALVLRGQDGWGPAAIDAATRGDSTIHVRIAEPVAVYIVYATAAAGADGIVSFFPDLYRHDAALARALQQLRRTGE
jgi:murein L,D-transpeptidase YcbB/YkuD